MSTSPYHIVFAGGGTAGHLFPGLAVAAELAKLDPPPRITFAGSGKSFEAKRVEEADFEYIELPCAPMPPGAKGLLTFLLKNFSGHRAARQYLRREKVSVVVGLGGYASVPMARAALSTNTPLVLLEQNAFPGKVTRWLSPRATLVCTAYDETQKHLRSVGPVRVTGNPIREGFRPRTKPRVSKNFRHRLLVLGGSGGAQSLNKKLPPALQKLGAALEGWQIVHQTGSRDLDATRELYKSLGLEATVVSFVQNFPQVLRRAELAVSRAGGTTLAELAATGIPAVLIPYPDATDDHQRQNAEFFVKGGAARMIEEATAVDRLDDAVAATLTDLLARDEKRHSMAAAMRQLAHPEAAWQVAKMVNELAAKSAKRSVA